VVVYRWRNSVMAKGSHREVQELPQQRLQIDADERMRGMHRINLGNNSQPTTVLREAATSMFF
jgi:hypothetical protein